MTEPLDLDELERRREYAIEQWREGDIDLVYDVVCFDMLPLLARVAELETSKRILADWITARDKSIAALEAAARAVVDAVWSPSTNVYLAGSLICRICMSPDGRHSQSCPVSALAALLEETP